MAFSAQLISFSENTSGYSVKKNGYSGSYYYTSYFFQSDTYTNSCLGWGTSFVQNQSNFESRTGTYSACETQTYYSGSTANSNAYSIAGLFNVGPFNTPPQTNLTLTGATVGSTSLYYKTIKSYGQYGYTYEEEFSLAAVGVSNSGKSSQVALYFTSTNTDSETIWTFGKSITTYATAGSTSSTYNEAPDGSTAFFYSTGTTTIFSECNSTSTFETTSFHGNSLFSTSETFEEISYLGSSQTFINLKTFFTTDLTLYGTGPKTYLYSVICTFDKTGNYIFTARTQFGENIRNSDTNILLGPPDQATFTKSDLILSVMNAGESTGYSTSYSLPYNYTYTIPATLTKTSLEKIYIGQTFGKNGYPAGLYSTSSYTEGAQFYSTDSSTQGFTFESYPPFGFSDGSFVSETCKQMVYTTSTHLKFYYTDTLTTSFVMTSYIFTTSGYTYFSNFPFTSTSYSSQTTDSNYNADALSDECFNQNTLASGTLSVREASGSTSFSAAQTIATNMGILSTRFRHPFNNTEYISTYYTEVLNAGLLINGERKAFWGYSPSSASICAFVDMQNTETAYSFAEPRPTANLFPYSGTFVSSDTSFSQLYSESPSVTTFSQTLSNSLGTQITTTSRTVLYSLTGSSTYVTSEQTNAPTDDYMYFPDTSQYPEYGYGVPQVFLTASNILNSFGYFATSGSYLLNDCIYTNGTGTLPVVEYIDGSQTFAYPISKGYFPQDYAVYYLDHGKFTATSVFPSAQLYGNYGTIEGGFIGGEIGLVFSNDY